MGNTSSPFTLPERLSVHPHACGEHQNSPTREYPFVGSSPRLWGTRLRLRRRRGRQRFIPTPVGNTAYMKMGRGDILVHPHACGEHGGDLLSVRLYLGSSPRLWGTPPELLSRHFPGRFIPTPVGNTEPHKDRPRRIPVHPHACGEHGPGVLGLDTIDGSSPRLWGTRSQSYRAPDLIWFIPTPVGNTPGAGVPQAGSWVHPHACGEHL